MKTIDFVISVLDEMIFCCIFLRFGSGLWGNQGGLDYEKDLGLNEQLK